jgi:hypothetical protein
MTSVASGSIKGRLVGPGDKRLAGTVRLERNTDKGLLDVDSYKTGANGEFEFVSVAEGDYVLTFPAEIKSGADTFRITNPTLSTSVSKARSAVDLGAINYEPATAASSSGTTPSQQIASVRGRLVSSFAKRGLVADVILEQVTSTGTVLSSRTERTSTNGDFVFTAVAAGSYNLKFPPAIVSGPDLFVANTLLKPINVAGADQDVGDIDYNAPVTRSSTRVTTPVVVPSGDTSGVPFDRIIDNGIRQVLGAVPPPDASRVLALLDRSFEARATSGTTYFQARRGGGAATVTSGGTLAGAPATLYQQAVELQQSVERLVNGLEPTITDPDEEKIAAFKDDIRATLASAVAEIGRPGGPVIQRLDVLRGILESDVATLFDELFEGEEQDVLDLDVTRSEQTQRDFELLQQYIGPNGTLKSIADAANASTNPSAGSNLARLAWTVEAIPATLRDVTDTMDAVNFGPSDRRATTIDPTNPLTITIEQLLAWIETSASNDWPRRLSAGAARVSELRNVQAEAVKQHDLVGILITNLAQIVRDDDGQVAAALDELNRELNEVITLTTAIIPSGFNPSTRRAPARA